VEVKPGTTTHALGVTSGASIDWDGSGGGMWRRDPSGQPHTSLTDKHGNAVDAQVTPYVVLPSPLRREHPDLKLGDIVALEFAGKTVYAELADVQTRRELGEISKKAADMLGIYSNPVL